MSKQSEIFPNPCHDLTTADPGPIAVASSCKCPLSIRLVQLEAKLHRKEKHPEYEYTVSSHPPPLDPPPPDDSGEWELNWEATKPALVSWRRKKKKYQEES